MSTLLQSRREHFPAYAKKVQEIVGPTKHWPHAIRRMFFKSHLSNQERFTVIVFLKTNGLSDYWTEQLLTYGIYDNAAYRQVKYLIDGAWKKYRQWNMTLGRSV